MRLMKETDSESSPSTDKLLTVRDIKTRNPLVMSEEESPSNRMTAEASSSSSEVSLQELQETVSRLSSHKGVESVLILNRSGDIVAASGRLLASSSTEGGSSEHSSEKTDNASYHISSPLTRHAQQTQHLLATATAYLNTLQPDNEVSFLQLRSKHKQELMIAPHQGYVLALLKQA